MTGKADAVRAVSQQFKDRTNTVIEGVMAHLRDDNAKEILGPGLSPLIGRGDLKSIVKFALYADVLRMVRDMVMADGEISDEEVKESLGLLSVLAAAFAKVRKEYASYTQLSNENACQFLSQYEADAGLFGYANEVTKWAGVELCRNIQSDCGDSGPNDAFSGSLVAWAESIAGSDEMVATERQVLESLYALTGHASDSEVTAGEGGLTKAIAQQFLNDEESVDLSEFSSLDEEAIRCLSGSDRHLNLDGIVHLSAASAKALAGYRGSISLGGLTTLSDAIASELAQSIGDRNLGNITHLPRHQADLFANNPRLTFDRLSSIEGLPCECEQIPERFPAADEIPLCAALLGWGTFRAMGVTGQPLRPGVDDLDSLAKNFPLHKPLFLAGWFVPFRPELLQHLAKFKGTLVISPDALEGGELTEDYAKILRSFDAEAICFSFAAGGEVLFRGMTPEVASELLNFKGHLRGDPSLIIFGRDGFDLLEQHWSVNADGRWTGLVEVGANAACRLCGENYVLCEREHAFEEQLQCWSDALIKQGWKRDSHFGWLCENCADTMTATGNTAGGAPAIVRSAEHIDADDDGEEWDDEVLEDEDWNDEELEDPDEEESDL